MSKYYALTWQNTPLGVSAYSLVEPPPVGQLIIDLEGKELIPFDFELKKVRETEKGLEVTSDMSGLKDVWEDYLTNNLAWPMMSLKMKTIIDKLLSGTEGLDWIAANVKNGEENKLYYVPRFNKKLDTLDTNATRVIPGTDQILKAVYSLSKIKSYSLFHEQLSHNLWKVTPFINVSEIIVKAMKKEKLTGVEFNKISVL